MTYMEATAPTISARREARGSKSVVIVTIDGDEQVLGGARASRANAVVVSSWTPLDEGRPQKAPGCELRADIAAAESLAASYLRGRKVQGFTCRPAQWAIVAPIS